MPRLSKWDYSPSGHYNGKLEATELTPLELQLLQLLASDATADAIACELGIARQSIYTACLNVYAKLGVSTRYGAITEGFRKGIIS